MKNDILKGLLACDGIKQATELGEEILSGLPLENIDIDKIRMAALERQIEIISEASRKIPDDWKNEQNQINWRGLAAIGNHLRHEYKNISKSQLWVFAKNDFENIKNAVLHMQEKYGSLKV